MGEVEDLHKKTIAESREIAELVEIPIDVFYDNPLTDGEFKLQAVLKTHRGIVEQQAKIIEANLKNQRERTHLLDRLTKEVSTQMAEDLRANKIPPKKTRWYHKFFSRLNPMRLFREDA
jgi:hypothetical protein